MSDAAEEPLLAPSAVLTAAADRLRADGHGELASAVRRVDAYLRDLAVAHTEIALTTDRLRDRGEALLSAKDTGTPAASPAASAHRSADAAPPAG